MTVAAILPKTRRILPNSPQCARTIRISKLRPRTPGVQARHWPATEEDYAPSTGRIRASALKTTKSREESVKKRTLPLLGFAALSMLGAAGWFSGAAAQTAGLRDDNPNDWPMYNRSFDGSRHSPLQQITRDNVKRLHVAWI